MNNPKVNFSNLPKDFQCPSGESFEETVRNITKDGKLSRKEADDMRACFHGHYLPKWEVCLTTDAMVKAGTIGLATQEIVDQNKGLTDPAKIKQLEELESELLDAEALAQEAISQRNMTQENMFFGTELGGIKERLVPRQLWSLSQLIQYAEKSGSHGITHEIDRTAYLPLKDNHSVKQHGKILSHESGHQYGHQNLAKLPVHLIEGLAEFTDYDMLIAAGDLYGQRKIAYQQPTSEAYRLSALVGDEALLETWYQGDLGKLQKAFEDKVGAGSWEKYLQIWKDYGENPSEYNITNAVDQLMPDEKTLEESRAGIAKHKTLVEKALKLPVLGIDDS